IDRGHAVRWATAPDACRRLEASGIDTIEVGPTFDDLRVTYFRRYPEVLSLAPADLPEFTFPRLFGEVAVEMMLDGVLAAARAWRPDLVVADSAAFAGLIAAAAIGVPSVAHSFGALTPRHRVEAAAGRQDKFWRSAGVEPRPFGGTYDGLYLDIYPPSLQTAAMDHVPHRQPLRPVAFDEVAGDTTTVWPADGDDRPLVYLTLGTVFRGAGLLPVACGAIASLDVRLLVTVGPAGDPAQLGSQPANVRVERYVPQTRVFDECVVVASHAGSGTFLAALARGIPQLCMPQAADQFLNAAGCAASGVGLTLLPEEAVGEAIATAVDRLLREDAFRARAAEVAAEIRAMPGPSDVAAILEASMSPPTDA
ncbi:MAG TPA: glycosyltransferase, partial [Candidatus Limnocylindrales bacterium]|nr:glycosyltransferase [Candidatus Limnocylindrales bacterium]